MKKISILLFVFLPLALFADIYTGFYFSPITSLKQVRFSDAGYTTPDKNYCTNTIIAFFSFYGVNNFESNFAFTFDKYLIEISNLFANRYSFAFEFGKNMSTEIGKIGKSILSPDFSGGLFAKFILFKPESTTKLYFSYGLYLFARLKIIISQKTSGIHSIDLGYKFYAPFNFNYYKDNDYSIQSYSHSFFIGFSL